jgi:hypothetical protein
LGISEAQLETWSAQGKTGQFTDTYDSIRGNLLDDMAPYPVKNCEIFLQGSYGNDTNVWADSDVDIVLKHNGAFCYDISGMSEKQQQAFKADFSKDAEYGYPQFKADAETWIKQLYDGAQVGTNAVFVSGSNGRRNADVLIAQQFRHYYSYEPTFHGYHEGVAFYAGGRRIENFPKQHSVNCTRKHKATNGNYKRIVRVFKNMRNAMIDEGVLAEGVAPSYFLEGMLYNVPNEKFKGTYSNMWVECFNWTVMADRTELTCANGLHWLVRDGTPTSWSVANFAAFNSCLAMSVLEEVDRLYQYSESQMWKFTRGRATLLNQGQIFVGPE